MVSVFERPWIKDKNKNIMQFTGVSFLNLNEIRQKKGMLQGQGPCNTHLLPNTALSSSKTLFSFTWSSLRWSLASASNCGWKKEHLVWTQRAVCCPLQCFSSLLRLHLISRWTIPTGLCQVGCSPPLPAAAATEAVKSSTDICLKSSK